MREVKSQMIVSCKELKKNVFEVCLNEFFNSRFIGKLPTDRRLSGSVNADGFRR